MPLDHSMSRSPLRNEWGLNTTVAWQLHFCLWPRKCFLTEKTLWLERCYKGSRTITGPGSDIVIDYHIDKYEFLIWQLKRNA